MGVVMYHRCSICKRLLYVQKDCESGRLVHCPNGHVAVYRPEDAVCKAELASEWVLRLVHAFPDKGRKEDIRVLVDAIQELEYQCQ